MWRRRAELTLRSGTLKLYCTISLTLFVLMYPIFLWLTHYDRPYLVFDPVNVSVGESSPKLQAIVCPKASKYCFKIEDYVSRGLYKRRLKIDQNDDVVLSVVELLSKPEAFTRDNSRKWPVRKDNLVLSYSKIVVAQAFVTGTFISTTNFTNTNTYNSLMIGLGGSGISNFIGSLPHNHQMTIVDIEPAMAYIAEQWFGLVPSASQKVVIQDGVQFLAERSNWSAKFDFMIIDACLTVVKSDDLLCPHKSFLQESVIKDMRRLMSDTGTLVVNTLVIDTPQNVERMSIRRQQILDDFRKHFTNCYYAKGVVNQMLTCTLNLQLMMTDLYYHKTIEQLPQPYKRELDLREVKITL
uniref:Methyltransferase-like protein 13 n=1 Tax=Ditylenchus dipsaci TaxID=166011 RepID=A0A915D3R0_9BILA